MSERLPSRWRRVQRQLEAELLARGVPPEAAAEWSYKDARARAHVAKVVGAKVAARASMILHDRGAGGVFTLTLDLGEVPAAKREAARAALLALGGKRLS